MANPSQASANVQLSGKWCTTHSFPTPSFFTQLIIHLHWISSLTFVYIYSTDLTCSAHAPAPQTQSRPRISSGNCRVLISMPWHYTDIFAFFLHFYVIFPIRYHLFSQIFLFCSLLTQPHCQVVPWSVFHLNNVPTSMTRMLQPIIQCSCNSDSFLKLVDQLQSSTSLPKQARMGSIGLSQIRHISHAHTKLGI